MASKEAINASFGESRDAASHKEAFKWESHFADKLASAQYMLFLGRLPENIMLAELCPLPL